MTLTNILSKLVSFRTLADDQAETRRCLDWVEEQLVDLPLTVRRYTSGGFPSLVITTRRTKRPKMLLQAHLDVVKADDSAFKPVKKGNKLYGRGTLDMKFAAACYLKLFQELGPDLPNYDLGVMLTTDEEKGGANGVPPLLKKGYSAEVCVLPDGGDDLHLERSAKGVLHLLVTSNGAGGHASQTWGATNAIDQLIRFLAEVKEHFSEPEDPETLGHYNTCNIGTIRGGEAINSVARQATAEIDIRTTPGVSKQDIYHVLKKIRQAYPEIRLSEIITADSFEIDLKHPHLVQFRKLAKQRLGITLEPFDSHGSSDARFFIAAGIPTVITRPKGGGYHAEREWIDLKSLGRFYDLLKAYVEMAGQRKRAHGTA